MITYIYIPAQRNGDLLATRSTLGINMQSVSTQYGDFVLNTPTSTRAKARLRQQLVRSLCSRRWSDRYNDYQALRRAK